LRHEQERDPFPDRRDLLIQQPVEPLLRHQTGGKKLLIEGAAVLAVARLVALGGGERDRFRLDGLPAAVAGNYRNTLSIVSPQQTGVRAGMNGGEPLTGSSPVK